MVATGFPSKLYIVQYIIILIQYVTSPILITCSGGKYNTEIVSSPSSPDLVSLSILLASNFPYCKTINAIHFLVTTKRNKQIVTASILEGESDSFKRSRRGKPFVNCGQ